MGKCVQNSTMLVIFGHVFAIIRCLGGRITPYSCRAGHKLQNEWSNIKIGQVLTSEMRKM